MQQTMLNGVIYCFLQTMFSFLMMCTYYLNFNSDIYKHKLVSYLGYCISLKRRGAWMGFGCQLFFITQPVMFLLRSPRQIVQIQMVNRLVSTYQNCCLYKNHIYVVEMASSYQQIGNNQSGLFKIINNQSGLFTHNKQLFCVIHT